MSVQIFLSFKLQYIGSLCIDASIIFSFIFISFKVILLIVFKKQIDFSCKAHTDTNRSKKGEQKSSALKELGKTLLLKQKLKSSLVFKLQCEL